MGYALPQAYMGVAGYGAAPNGTSTDPAAAALSYMTSAGVGADGTATDPAIAAAAAAMTSYLSTPQPTAPQ
eukprot:NODE_4989_length_611_cov_92.786477_g4303_i0.p3 GENE.NODE_4989_length_611_cov_92.786477_g4303_i0~~NODE_4989_length_611_cov_92.786477_g4303_i0.p3  ORF type:complete len:71 (-),score=13.59 NODE_4989_length_611_cov_92.786477_g4303_i0:131-343(-)